jgi:transposase
MALLTRSPQEREGLDVLGAGPPHAHALRRAQTLRWRAAGERPPEVAARLRVTRQTLDTWVRRLQGHTAPDLTARLAVGARRGRPRPVHGLLEPLLVAGIDQAPRQLGARATVWTAPLLTHSRGDKPHRRVARPRVSLAMARRGRRWQRPRHDRARRLAPWRQAQGGSNAASPRARAPAS